MVFSDPAFLYFFLPAALLLAYAAMALRLFAPAMLVVSLVFFYWSSGLYTLLLVASIAVNFGGGLLVEATRRRSVLAALIAANLALLGWFKYLHFGLGLAGHLGSPALAAFTAQIVLPIGISFYTFQGISYLVDVWRRDVAAARNPLLFGAYLSFFPQLIAGPIVRYRDVAGAFRRPAPSLDLMAGGAGRFLVGLAKKVVIADTVARLADAAFAAPIAELNFLGAWLGAIAYTAQIYFDFSGYSDMAIGLAMLMGIHLRENFNHPYAAHSLTEFWRRWHISLSSWFRDYLYIPLGGSHGSPARTYFNLALVFLATGLWHGAAWTFVLWGAWHGALLMAERAMFGRAAGERRSQLARLAYFLPAVIFGWVLFRAPSTPFFLAYAGWMLSPFSPGALSVPDAMLLVLSTQAQIALALAVAAILAQGLYRPAGQVIGDPQAGRAWALLRPVLVAGLGVVCAMHTVPHSFAPFLYFRF